MARSHPPTLITLVHRTLKDDCRLEKGERVLVALSGGGDSTALLHVLSRLRERLGVTVVAHGVNHGLRAEARLELDLAGRLAERYGVPFTRTDISVAPGGNLQARARDLRYGALRDAMRVTGATRLATAHHADDRAETFILRLLHGGSPAGLAVLPAMDGVAIRPMLRARKSDVIKHLRRHDIPFSEDPSNQDRRFMRVRVRLDVMPLLESLSPAIVSHLASLADELAAEPLPDLIDAEGEAVSLNRAQTAALRRAKWLGRGTRILLSGNREIVFEPKAYEVRVDATPDSRNETEKARRRPPLWKKGGAKSGKSG